MKLEIKDSKLDRIRFHHNHILPAKKIVLLSWKELSIAHSAKIEVFTGKGSGGDFELRIENIVIVCRIRSSCHFQTYAHQFTLRSKGHPNELKLILNKNPYHFLLYGFSNKNLKEPENNYPTHIARHRIIDLNAFKEQYSPEKAGKAIPNTDNEGTMLTPFDIEKFSNIVVHENMPEDLTYKSLGRKQKVRRRGFFDK